jgi:NAD(P)-dependent dehydrogenase (short-subunit alcohol dehydrogenase family)
MSTSSGHALVTGGGNGIGRAIALRLAQDGRDVSVLDRDLAAAQATAERVRSLGRQAAAIEVDVGRRDSVRAAVNQATAALGPIDALVNNAGILRTAPFLDVSERDWRDLMSVNLDGVFHCSQAVLPGMLARANGCIVNMSSWTGKKGVPNHAAYAATKAAIIALTQSVAGELADRGIRVNAVCPGTIVNTQMRDQAEKLNAAQGLPDVHTRVKTVIPMRRAGTPEDVAGVVAFLLSADAAYMTGQAINITGGLWMN